MDDMNAFERQVAGRIERLVGPASPVDDAAIFSAITATQSPAWRFQSLLSATKFVVAGAVVALFGGFLLIAQPFDRVNVPGAETAGLPPVTGPAGNGLVAFSRDGDIHVGDPLTGESEVIVAGPRYDTGPMFSPDGALVAFQRCEQEGYDKEDFEAGRDCSATPMVVRADGSDGHVVASEGAGVLWTPDGRSLIVYERREPTGTLTMLDASGVAPPRKVTLPTLDLRLPGPAFRAYFEVATFMRPPLGDRILAWSQTARPGYLDVMDADGSNVTRLIDETWLTEHGFKPWLVAPRWSPDGSMIAFETNADEDGLPVVVVMGEEGDGLRVLAGGFSARWSPDGARILSQRERGCDAPEGCESQLVITDIATGVEQEVATGPYLYSWSPDGTSILYAAGEPQARMYTVDIESGEVTALPPEWDAGDPGPSWQRVAAD